MAEQRGCIWRGALVGLGLLVAAALLAGGLAAYWYLSPYRGFGIEKFVEIEHGESSRAIATQLQRQGVVRSRWAFLLVRYLHPRASLQAGEYRFAGEATPAQVFNKIRHGEIFYEEFTVPEGSNMFDIANLLASSDTIQAADFLKAAADPRTIHDLDPAAPSLEGYLFPSTYRVTRKTTARQLCRAMTAEFRKEWDKLGAPASTIEVHRVVTLASLVEKETAAKSERPEVASVFSNRLKMGMALQCDPTTVYAALLENKYRGVIHKSDLASTSPYNTYTHTGLPPGPIANPGALSLQAALHPAQTSFLYFVAKPNGEGAHAFSQTLAEHQKAVEAYRRSSK